ncbi:uncharacterized protein LOC134667766 [Cydia fagiglandana]|uniref:uncharacterized protein LOC134667766 n=1 Tax=Cydia fagiglandana TaxID=1458189 RepID=UPI002FEE57FB
MMAREVVRRVLEAREGKLEVAVLFCDLSKAFDVVDHGLLSSKLHHYGIRGPAQALMSDFMNKRTQYVTGQRGTLNSHGLSAAIGVPQGSSLSNVVFSILLNDLPMAVSEGEVYMYADDVAAIVTAPSIDQLESKLNLVAGQLSNWFEQNGLILNLTKTHFIQFDLSGRKRRPLHVGLAGGTIDQPKPPPVHTERTAHTEAPLSMSHLPTADGSTPRHARPSQRAPERPRGTSTQTEHLAREAASQDAGSFRPVILTSFRLSTIVVAPPPP